MPAPFRFWKGRSVVGAAVIALAMAAVLAPAAFGSRPITTTGGATWSSTSPASSISATVYVSAIDCGSQAAGTYGGQQAGIELFGSYTSGGATVYPFDFAGFYSYCHGKTALYKPEFITSDPSTGLLTFKTASLGIAPGDPLSLSITTGATGMTLKIEDLNTHKTVTRTGPLLGPSTGWTAGVTPIFGGASGAPYLNTSVPLVDQYTPTGGPTTIAGPVPFAAVVFDGLTVDGETVSSQGQISDAAKRVDPAAHSAAGTYQGGLDGSSWIGPTGKSDADVTQPVLGNFIASRVKFEPPKIGTNADVTPVSGTTLIELPGSHHFKKLSSPAQIPTGSRFDAGKGSVQLTLGLPHGKFETGIFYSGSFSLQQNKTNGAATATLSGGSFATCSSASQASAAAVDDDLASVAKAKKKSKKKVRSLWANAHGDFTTKGSDGAAAVLGTRWYTEDRCDGTYFKVVRDKITVTAYYPQRHTVTVTQGHSFLAPPPPPAEPGCGIPVHTPCAILLPAPSVRHASVRSARIASPLAQPFFGERPRVRRRV